MLGVGIALWFVLPRPAEWWAAGLGLIAVALAGAALGRGGRASRAVLIGGLAAATGLALMAWRADRVAAPVLARPLVARFTAEVERVQPLAARDLVRLTLRPVGMGQDGRGRATPLPPRVRVNLAEGDVVPGIGTGAIVRLRARLMPPQGAAVSGAYDFARVAWFQGIGATGRGFAPVQLLRPAAAEPGMRAALSAHVTARLDGSVGGIAAALATGDVGAIAEADAEAMRTAGLAHLLSVSGLHITAVVGATMLIAMRLLALIPALALRVRLPIVAGAAGAAAAIGYTLLTGAEVPTIRSCVAALLVLVALALGREAMTLRLVATGALAVLLCWPESLTGASFQLSFAAITAIVALHEHPRVRRFGQVRDENALRRLARNAVLLLLTGIVVEAALMPIAVYHFHKAGMYGAVANIVAIPLTTFVIMPLEVVALLLDLVGLGAPAWWLTGLAIRLLLGLAHWVAAAPGAVSAWPLMPTGAFAAIVLGGAWIALWRSDWRRWGVLPIAAGIAWAATTPPPDLLVSGDGRHVALRTADGELALLRDRTGDYMRDVMAANGGVAEPGLMSEGGGRCSPDLCVAEVRRGARMWRVLMTRSAYPVPWRELVAACRAADIVVSDRRLPRRCTPRWLRLDRVELARRGGVAVTFAGGWVTTVRDPADRHPWLVPPPVDQPGTMAASSRSMSTVAKAVYSSATP
ncbi:ComEC/Rec2 family competence protein [Sphingomonas rubra]|nr:ComEC/Rec2 family competence protein [Sphingomonas rubra]